jgi:hypothetical protein
MFTIHNAPYFQILVESKYKFLFLIILDSGVNLIIKTTVIISLD